MITFVALGGQVEVTLTEEVARRLELEAGAGTHVFSTEAPTDLRVGERALLFLDFEPIDGLYGGRYGELTQLTPADPLTYKYSIEGEVAVNATDPSFSLPVAELRTLVRRELAARAGPEPSAGLMFSTPHPVGPGSPGSNEKTEPAHTHFE